MEDAKGQKTRIEMLKLVKAENTNQSLLDVSNSIQEEYREYYFDTEMGVSLEEHVNKLKQYPGLQIEIREDREKNNIIRLTMKKEFQVQLDDVINFDEEKA